MVAGIRPVYMRQGIDRAVGDVVEQLKAMSVPIKGKEDLIKVAAIAANNDAVIGQHIADALDKVGNDGVVTLDEGKTMQTGLSGSKECN